MSSVDGASDHAARKRSCRYAVLCGAGISKGAGLPLAMEFVEECIREIGPDGRSKHKLRTLIAEQQNGPKLRFEGLVEVLKHYKDENLAILDQFSGGRLQAVHWHLAELARSKPVVTTNFDGLIELAIKSGASDAPAHYSWNEASMAADPGLYKLHGTLWKLKGTDLEPVSASATLGPSATLERISAVRHSSVRRTFVQAVFKNHPVVVIGYSGSDDFDISFWLRELKEVKQVVWLQHHGETPEPVTLKPDQCLDDNRVDEGAKLLAKALIKQGNHRALVVKVVNDPTTRLLPALINADTGRLVPEVCLDREKGDWQWTNAERHLVTGAIFLHTFRLVDAVEHLNQVLNLSDDPKCRVKSMVALAEAYFYTATREKRDECKRLAGEAAKLAEKEGLPYWRLRAELFHCLEEALVSGDKSEPLIAVAEQARDEQMLDIVAQAMTVLAQGSRLHGKTAIDLKEYVHSLGAEFRGQHEQLRPKWDQASDAEALRGIAEGFGSVGEDRLAAGDAPGACDSFTQQGVVLIRSMDWAKAVGLSPRTDDLMRAKEIMKRVRDISGECGLCRQAYASELALAMIRLRLEPSPSCEGTCEAIADCYASVIQGDANEILRFESVRIIEFLGVQGLKALAESAAWFLTLAKPCAEPAAGAQIRMRTTAHINACVLASWTRGETFTASNPKAIEALVGTSPTSPYWVARIGALTRTNAPDSDEDLREALWMLCDPQPPNPPPRLAGNPQ